MTPYQPLTPDEVRATALAYYQQRQAKAIAVDRPTLVLVGGQPGAGKSSAAKIVRAELRQAGGFVHLDADRMRERINLRGTTPTSEQTQVTAGALVTALRTLAIDGRRNLLEEGTFRNAASLEALVRRVQAAGYRVELVAVATPLDESRLGIHQRFEAQHAQGALNPRFVSASYHDESAQGFADTVGKLAGSFDRTRVINRAGEVSYDSHAVAPTTSAVVALKTGQLLDSQRLSEVTASWAHVRTLAVGRGAPGEYLQGIDAHVQRVLQSQQAQSIAPDPQGMAARRAFELALDAKSVPEILRDQLRARFEVEMGQRRGRGEEVDVKVFDASAVKRGTSLPARDTSPTPDIPKPGQGGPKPGGL
jgi:UDP-N-acetylglucosamine kinase